MRVTITGATGNVGTALVRALERDPEVEEIVGIARREPVWKPAKTRWWYTLRTFRAWCFITVAFILTCPSPAMATWAS